MGDDSGENSSPEYTGSFLFLVDLAIGFKRCSKARSNNNIQELFRALDAVSLGLSGYYDKSSASKNEAIEKEIEKDLNVLRLDIDKMAVDYEQTHILKIPQKIYAGLYQLERRLRKAWKDSGLQMSMKAGGDSDSSEFA